MIRKLNFPLWLQVSDCDPETSTYSNSGFMKRAQMAAYAEGVLETFSERLQTVRYVWKDTHMHTRSGRRQTEEDCAAWLPSALHG